MKPAKQGDTVRVHYTGTLEDGTVFDTSIGREPLEFTIGSLEVLPGFEAAVIGLEVGQKKTFSVAPEDAYGVWRREKVFTIGRERLPEGMDPKPGMILEGRTSAGAVSFLVLEVNDREITLDANHPLAGKELHFEIELVEIVSSA